MTHIIRPQMPTVLVRAFDAFRANDAVTIGEVFEPHAFLVSHVDPKLLALVGMPPEKPVRSRGNVDITQLFAHEFSAMQITYTELHSDVRVGRELAASCDFEAKILSTGQTVAARCAGIYTLSRTGRKVESGRTVCKLITPGWDFTFN